MTPDVELAAAARLRSEDWEAFDAIAVTPVSFGYTDSGTELRACQPLIHLDPGRPVRGVRFKRSSVRLITLGPGITDIFTEPAERARAIGVWGGVFGLSMAMGPVVGGALVDAVGWRGVFWVNIPVGIAALVLTALFVPESKAARPRRPDPFGQLLVIVLLGSLTYAVIEGPSYGWESARIMFFFALAVIALAVFLGHERRREEPLVDLRVFRSLPFSG